MRILITADPELPVPPMLYGGIERIIDILVRSYREKKIEVGLLAHKDSTVGANAMLSWPGKKSQSKIDSIKNMSTMLRAYKDFQPDVIHSFSRILYLLPLMFNKVPIVMSYQREPGEKNIRRAKTIDRNNKLSFTGCSQYICANGIRGGGEWTAIHNCIEINKYSFQSEVSQDAPLVFLSRLDRIKGAHHAIEVAKKTNQRLVIAGNYAKSGPEADYYLNIIKPELGKNRIEYIGPVDDFQKNILLGSAKAMIVPIEWNEPFGIVFIEALACGTPVISSPTGALPEIVNSGEHGYLCHGIDQLCNAVENINKIDRKACRQRVEACFSAEIVADKYLSLYKNVLEEMRN